MFRPERKKAEEKLLSLQKRAEGGVLQGRLGEYRQALAGMAMQVAECRRRSWSRSKRIPAWQIRQMP
ncbi:hypothetical protein KDH83_31300 [Achromobacter sp. Marseille-Q0513]|uniref:hypothetical protein n=1 Tax=Achromobacter sp. Marseille-Q0513 TaxID=2829161 RepID=UPI001B957F3A|nr:hypothetical protein [Achromobacter sp. Marseille-Q0513]MBR8657806.1 hypothetical protein [Achromobacter sp. Marseille-Q0513]